MRPAIPKALLISEAMLQAAAARLDATAQATLAHIVAASYPTNSGAWAVRISLAELASRLSCHRGTVKRALARLRDAELVLVNHGKGQNVSRFTVNVSTHSRAVHPSDTSERGCAGAPSPFEEECAGAPSDGAPEHRGGSAGAPSEGAPARPDAARQQTSSSSSNADRAAAAVRELPNTHNGSAMKSQAADVLFRLLNRRPEWLPDGKPWIDGTTCSDLVALPHVTVDVIAWALSLAKQRRQTLHNAAGYVVKQIRDPDLADVQRVMTIKRASELARQQRERAPSYPRQRAAEHGPTLTLEQRSAMMREERAQRLELAQREQ